MKIAVYTCVTNQYDFIFPPITKDPKLSFFCFTDNPQQRIDGWKVLPLQWHHDSANGTLINRYHKFFPHKILPDYSWSIYVDGNIRITGPLSEIAEKLISKNVLMACPAHPERNTLFEEVEACEALDKFGPGEYELARQQYAHYLSQGMPVDCQLLANYFIVRKHANHFLQDAMEAWWQEFHNWTKRDQLSLPYILWYTQLPHTSLTTSCLRNNSYFFRDSHRRRGIRKWFQLAHNPNQKPRWMWEFLRLIRRLFRRLKRLSAFLFK